MIARLLFVPFVLLMVLPVRADESQWTRFRGPNGSGISDATTVPVTWTDKDYNWKARVPGQGHASPVVWRNRIFLTSADPGTARRFVHCLNAADGALLWRRNYPSATYRQHRENSFATATPVVDDEGVVVTWTTPEEVVLLSLDVEGNEIWRRDLGPFVGLHGSGSSPIIVDDLVVLANDQMDPQKMARFLPKGTPIGPPGESFLIAVNRSTGRTRWQLPRRTAIAAYSTPCVRRSADRRSELVLSSTSHGITAVGVTAGKVNWEIADVFPDRCVGSPIVEDGLVFAAYGHGTRGSRFVAVRPGRPTRGVEPKIEYDVTKSVPLVPTALIKDDRLFLWCDDGVVTCLRPSTGEEVWRERVGGAFFGSPVWVDQRLYCISKTGEVVVLAAADEFQVLARVPLGDTSYATPAVANGVMYLRTASYLFSLGGKEE